MFSTLETFCQEEPRSSFSSCTRLGLSLLLLSAAPLGAVPAFPGAEGYGAATRGAYTSSAPVIKFVDNLNNSGAGSFRDALANDYGKARVIIFRVGGTIELTSDLWVRPTGSAKIGRVTIAGQTAPGGGICLKGAGLRVMADDVIVRGLRIRPGDGATGSPKDNRDCISIEKDGSNLSPKRIIIDHCSLSWSVDETFTTWGHDTTGKAPSDITLQWCILSEALRSAGHSKGSHSMSTLIGYGTKNVSIHHNVYSQNVWRNPLLQEDTTSEVVNNVIRHGSYPTCMWDYNSASTLVSKAHVLRNYYNKGTLGLKHMDLGVPTNTYQPPLGSLYYCQGNIGGLRTSDTMDEWVGVEGRAGVNIAPYRSNSPVLTTLPVYPISMDSTAQACFDPVMEGAGATVPARDAVDTRVVQDILNDPMTGGLIDSPNAVGGWPVLAAGTAPLDTDQDGMPDAWETAHATDPLVFDPHGDVDGNGYANLEDYLNSFYPTVVYSVPEADTYAYDGAPTTNYGTSTGLTVKNTNGTIYTRASYLRFPVSGTANSVTLNLTVTSVGAEGSGARTVEIRELSDDSWSETAVNWNNKPSITGTLMAAIDAGTVGQTYSIDVTSYVNQQAALDGKASFVLVQPYNTNRGVTFGSRENSANFPFLESQ